MLTVSEITEANATLEQCHRTPEKINHPSVWLYMSVDNSHTRAKWIQENPYDRCENAGPAKALLLGKHCRLDEL